MALTKITFDGSSVSSRQDAEINHHITGLVPAGIIEGLGGEVAYSVSNNYITFKSGYVQIYGRRIYVEDGSSIYISLDADKYGYAIIEVNMANNSVNLTKVEGDTYPTLKQNNLLETSGIYQFPLAKYHKTTSSIELIAFTRSYLKSGPKLANEALTKANALSLKSKSVSKLLTTSGSSSTATLDLSTFPKGTIVLISFCSYDEYGYGAYEVIYGSIPLRYDDDISYGYLKIMIQGVSSGTVSGTIGPLDGTNLPVALAGTTNTAPLVRATCYYVG